MKWKLICCAAAMLICIDVGHIYSSQTAQTERHTAVVRSVVNDAFSLLIHTSERVAVDRAFLILDANWKPEFIPQLLDIMSVPRRDYIVQKIITLLTDKTGQDFGPRLNNWYFWWWNQPETALPSYGNFKADLYEQIDPRFAGYFRERQPSARIRLDEVRWGGVRQDGIPPLRNPEMISAAQATYLENGNIIFGLEINGDARAYPKRILAWHEMFTDTIGGFSESAGLHRAKTLNVYAWADSRANGTGTVYVLR